MSYFYNPKGFVSGNPLKGYRRVDRVVKGKVTASYGVMIPALKRVYPELKPVVYIAKKATDTRKRVAVEATLARNVWRDIVSTARQKVENPQKAEKGQQLVLDLQEAS